MVRSWGVVGADGGVALGDQVAGQDQVENAPPTRSPHMLPRAPDRRDRSDSYAARLSPLTFQIVPSTTSRFSTLGMSTARTASSQEFISGPARIASSSGALARLPGP